MTADPAVWNWGPHLELRFAAEGFGSVMAVLVPVIAIPVITYAAVHEPREGKRRLIALLVAFVAAMELLVLAADFLTLLIGWELVGACSWALIGHDWRDPATAPAARRAFLVTRFGDLGLYIAAAAAMAGSGSLAFRDLGALHGAALHVAAAGILLAAMAKSAQMPFSPWLFSAMVGPTPVSALLHSATMVAAGAYLLIRLAPALASADWLLPATAAVGLVTTFAGALVALAQRDIKLALAGSTSSQYGLMFVAVGAGSTAAAGTHLVTHAAFKALLFLGAGIAIQAAGTRDLARLRLGKAMPWGAAAFAIGALALAAVPPLGGAFSKELVLHAAWEHSRWVGVAVLGSGAFTALYAARLHLLAFGPGERRLAPRPSRLELVSVWMLAAISIGLGVLWLPAIRAEIRQLMGVSLDPGPLGELALGLIASAVGVAAGVLLLRRRALFTLGLDSRVQDAIAGWFALPVLGRRLVVGPALGLSAALASFDARVVDAGVRAAGVFGTWISRRLASAGEWSLDGLVQRLTALFNMVARLLSSIVEWSIDRLVGLVAILFEALAGGSEIVDDGAIDVTVERTAQGVARAGEAMRRLQTGLAHQYFLIVALGLAGAVALALFTR